MDGKGVFITFEGGDGVGKSTQVKFLAEALERHGLEVVCLREPGGTAVGEQLRALVLDPAHGEMSDQAELLIYEAARAQLVQEVIAPALDRGAVVLCDRFIDSTVAYQSYGRGLSRVFVDQANAFACAGIVPDKTILLVCEGAAREGLDRVEANGETDRLEQAGLYFHSCVTLGFLEIAKQEAKRVSVVVSQETKQQTQALVAEELSGIWPWLPDAVNAQGEEGC